MGSRPEGTSLNRIDNDGDYCRENCEWATLKNQSNNTSTSLYAEISGETRTVTEWCDYYGVCSRMTAYKRIELGWTAERAVSTPTGKKGVHGNIDLLDNRADGRSIGNSKKY